MIPATRARLCAALERETGRVWTHDDGDHIAWPGGIHSNTVLGYVEVERVGATVWMCQGYHKRDLGLFTGFRWPERLAAEVARVLREGT